MKHKNFDFRFLFKPIKNKKCQSHFGQNVCYIEMLTIFQYCLTVPLILLVSRYR